MTLLKPAMTIQKQKIYLFMCIDYLLRISVVPIHPLYQEKPQFLFIEPLMQLGEPFFSFIHTHSIIVSLCSPSSPVGCNNHLQLLEVFSDGTPEAPLLFAILSTQNILH